MSSGRSFDGSRRGMPPCHSRHPERARPAPPGGHADFQAAPTRDPSSSMHHSGLRCGPCRCVCVALLLLAGCGGGGEQEKGGEGDRPTVVAVAPVRAEPVTRVIKGVGDLLAAEAVVLTAESAGRVAAVLFTEGQRVPRGQVLVRFEAEEEQAQVAVATADTSELRRAANSPWWLTSAPSRPPSAKWPTRWPAAASSRGARRARARARRASRARAARRAALPRGRGVHHRVAGRAARPVRRRAGGNRGPPRRTRRAGQPLREPRRRRALRLAQVARPRGAPRRGRPPPRRARNEHNGPRR